MPEIHNNVVRIARTKKIPLCEVEKKANLSAGTISKWKFITPRVSSLVSVAAVLEVTVDELLREEQEGGEKSEKKRFLL